MIKHPQNNQPQILPSNRKFGMFFSAIFFISAVYGVWHSAFLWAILLFIVAFIFAALVFISPSSLISLNKLWFKLGMLIGRIISPVILGFIFFVIITPVAIIARLLGRDELLLKKRAISSYWIDRIPTGPHPESFKDQF